VKATEPQGAPARRRMRRKIILSGVLLGALFFGLYAAVGRVTAGSSPSPSVLQRPRTAADTLPSAVASQLSAQGFETSSSRLIASSLYIVPRTDGLLCMVSVGSVGSHIGCQPSSNFFNGSPLIFGIADGGPGSATVHIAGVAQSNVARVSLTVGGSTITTQPSSDGGFSVDVPVSSAAAAAASLGTVDAIDAGGKVLQSYTLPSS
jgi:hypothetical protein